MTCSSLSLLFFTFLFLNLYVQHANSEALQLTHENYQDTLNKNKLVFVNFYADWCMFSAQLAPIFHQAADIIHEEYPNVKLGRVDCERQQQLALDNAISKYPTLKLFRNGKVLRKEYRGARSVDAFSQYIKQQLKPSLVDVIKPEDITVNEKRNTIIGYFESTNSPGYNALAAVADDMRETTDFIAALGEASAKDRAVGESIVFKPKKNSGEHDAVYTADMSNVEFLKTWSNDKANPLVREITFENGEELTEEGLPFLILFHKKDDVTSIQRYKNAVMRELMHERGRINFLTADGQTFSHPLHHLGKNIDDLPLICIDSFRHMYLFKNFNDIDVSGKVKQFVADLHSGKLHQDFHNPPPEDQGQIQGHHHGQPSQPEKKQPEQKQDPNNAPKHDNKDSNKQPQETKQPPESTFHKLAPSDSRYTLLNDWRSNKERIDL